ncbi:HlyD family secretion protein [[Kitasatospora] papulosa]|uniref:hypothetical protein n=1 Tax=[Kitasatospora] papulosa TaxID=1464011 RepID=UPI0036B6305D
MSAYDELAAQVAAHGPFPMPTGDTGPAPMSAERLIEIRLRVEAATPGPWEEHLPYGDSFYAYLNGPYLRGVGTLEFGDGEDAEADRAFTLNARQDVPALLAEVDRLRALAAEQARRPRRFTPLEEAVRNIETAIAPLKGDERAGADMVLAYLRTLTTPGAVTEVDRLSDELTGANLSLYEEELDNARLRLALASAKRGRRELRAQVVELEAQRDRRRARLVALQNDALSMRGSLSPNGEASKVPFELGPTLTPAVDWLINRVAELEVALADATEPDVDGAGRTYQEYNPAPRDLRPGADAARRMIADRQTAEDPHDSPLHHGYALSRDLPRVAEEDPARCLDVHPFTPRDGWRLTCGSCDHAEGAPCHHRGGTS